jgi:hypothetical protein
MKKLITQIIKAFTTQKKASTRTTEYQQYVERIREALENN